MQQPHSLLSNLHFYSLKLWWVSIEVFFLFLMFLH